MLVALLTIFVDILGFGIIIPGQPFYAKSLGADPTTVTLLAATYSGMQFLFASAWGRLSDRVGRRRVMLASVSFSVLGYVLFACADSVAMLFVARFLMGGGTSSFAVAQAVVADTTSGPERARGMGLLGAAFGVGFVLGPAIGAGASQISASAPFCFSAVLAALNLVFALRWLPETLPPERRGRRPGPWLPLLDIRGAGRYVNLPRLLGIAALGIMAMGLMESALGLLIEAVWVLPASGGIATEATHQRAAALTAVPLVVVGLVAAFVQGGMAGRLSRRFGERVLVRAGALIATVGFVLVAALPGTGSFIVFAVLGAAVLAAGTSTLIPATSAFISRSVPAEDQGRWLGVSQSLSSLGRTLGPALSGFMFAQWTLLPFIVAAGVMAIVALVSLALRPLHAPD